jgi:predicted nucleotidyltransferase
MKLHNYLELVLGNKGTISVLRALVRYQGKVYTVRSLAEDAGISHTETAATINDLEKLGIVEVQPVGRAHQVSLNKKNRTFNKIIIPSINVEKNTLAELIQLLKKDLTTSKIISAVIFGSVARGEEKIDSDIDLLIVSNDHDHAIDQISIASRKVFAIFHGELSHIVFTEKEFKAKKRGQLVQSMINDHILISGKRPQDI